MLIDRTHEGEPGTGRADATSTARPDVSVDFEHFYEREMPRLIKFLKFAVGVRGYKVTGYEVEEIAQDTMVKAWSEWPRLAAADDRGRYLRAVAMNSFIDLARRSARGQELVAHLERVESASPAVSNDPAKRVLEREVVTELLQVLSDTQRRVVGLLYDGYRTTEIADILEQNPATLRSNLRHARRMLMARCELHDGRRAS